MLYCSQSITVDCHIRKRLSPFNSQRVKLCIFHFIRLYSRDCRSAVYIFFSRYSLGIYCMQFYVIGQCETGKQGDRLGEYAKDHLGQELSWQSGLQALSLRQAK